MTTAIIGTGGLGSVIARQLGSGGENLRLASADTESARSLAAQISAAAVAAADNRDAVQGAGAVVLALRFTVLQGRHSRDRRLANRQGRGRAKQPAQYRRTRERRPGASGRAVVWRGGGRVAAGRSAPGPGVRDAVGRSLRIRGQPVPAARGLVLRDRRRPGRRGSRAADQDGRLRAGEGRRDRPVGPARSGRRPSRSGSRPGRSALIDRSGLTGWPASTRAERPGVKLARVTAWPGGVRSECQAARNSARSGDKGRTRRPATVRHRASRCQARP